MAKVQPWQRRAAVGMDYITQYYRTIGSLGRVSRYDLFIRSTYRATFDTRKEAKEYAKEHFSIVF